jgi:hypothetical protein
MIQGLAETISGNEDLTVGKDHLQRFYIIPRGTILYCMRAAGVVGDHSAQGAIVCRGGIDGEEFTQGLQDSV